MKLRYKAITAEGKRIEGVIDAKEIGEAAGYLRSRALMLISIKKEKTSKSFNFLPGMAKVKTGDLVLFTRQLSSMISSGLTLLKSLEILKTQTDNNALIEIIDSIVGDVEEGRQLSFAIAKYPNIFSSVYISLIKAAESSGLMDKVLARLADNLEKQQKLKSTIKGAFLYPAIVVTLMGAVMIIMMVFVIPQLSTLYKSLNVDLPLPTKIVVGLSNFIITFWPVIIGAIFVLGFAYRRWHKTIGGKIIMDNVLLRLPIFGKLTEQKILTEFSRTLGLLIGTGTLVVKALNETADTTGNVHYTNAIKDVSTRVEKGVPLGDAIASYELFPPILVQLVKVGEQTGKLDETLSRASEYFDREVEQKVKALTTILEPFIMIVLGVGVGFLIISVIMPIYNLTSSIK